ncbi:uncharacterized protein LOC123347462 [Mauremys mutica]|uniref:uncharacterized protein LOC123347462 n=1 Tax=Mauremys mutica TaxID=74926 RepID=UPI001D1604AF|nr:uncharacterized protein LOC123347462 [Mauremys mutica]
MERQVCVILDADHPEPEPEAAWLQILPRLVSSTGTEGPGSSPDSQPPTTVPAPPAPSLSLSPPSPVRGQQVQLTCSAPRGSGALGFVFYEQRSGIWERLRSQSSGTWRISTENSELSRTFTCSYRIQSSPPRQPHSQSLQSNAVTLLLTDPPPQPVLSVDPPSGVVSEGLPLLITCMAPGDASKRRFHFYKDGAALIPGDTGSEISTTEPSTGSMNFSVLSILRADPSNTGEFSCGYEVNMSGRWIPSPRSQALNVTVTAWSLPVPLVAGCSGAAAALALLLLLICLCRKKKAATRRLSTSYWKSQELRRSRIMRRSTDISGVNMGLQQRTEGGWPQAVSQDWGLLPKLPAEGPRPGQAAGGAAPLKGQKEEDDADSGAEFEFPDIDPTYSQVTFSCSTFRQGQELSASHVCSTPDL